MLVFFKSFFPIENFERIALQACFQDCYRQKKIAAEGLNEKSMVNLLISMVNLSISMVNFSVRLVNLSIINENYFQ